MTVRNPVYFSEKRQKILQNNTFPGSKPVFAEGVNLGTYTTRELLDELGDRGVEYIPDSKRRDRQ